MSKTVLWSKTLLTFWPALLVGVSELLMGINGMRNRLAKQCSGNVLEVSCGYVFSM